MVVLLLFKSFSRYFFYINKSKYPDRTMSNDEHWSFIYEKMIKSLLRYSRKVKLIEILQQSGSYNHPATDKYGLYFKLIFNESW